MEVCHVRLVRRRAVGHDRAIAVIGGIRRPAESRAAPAGQIAKGPVARGRLGQHAMEGLRTGQRGLAPDELLHRLLGLDPGSARLAPAGRAENRHLKAQPVRLSGGVADRIEPLRVPKEDLRLHGLASARADIRQLHAADSHPVHPLEVLVDPLLGNVAIGPVPPGPGLGRVGRILESLGQGINRTLGGGGQDGAEGSEGEGGKQAAGVRGHKGNGR